MQYESRWSYYSKHLGTWAACVSMFLYTELSSAWPQDDREWFLLGLKSVPYVLGVAVSVQGANRVAVK